MKIGIAEIPSPFLVARRVVACGDNGRWHDLIDLLRRIGIADLPPASDLPTTLHYLSRLAANSRARIARALDAESGNSDDFVPTRKPVGESSKLLLTEGAIALSRSNDQRSATMVVGFSKFSTAFADPDAEINLPDTAACYDAEATLVAVLGRPAARVSTAAAARSIIGFTLMAEITDRGMFDAEARTHNSLFAKNCHGLSPCGPCIWLTDEGDVDAATEITLTHNGVLRQRFTVADFAHSIRDAVKAWSRVALEPGDMVALGAGIAWPHNDNAVDSSVSIAPGDHLEVACPMIGALRARFTAR